MGWREEVLLDQQFFGSASGISAAQKKIIEYATGAIGGIMVTLNCIYYLKKEIGEHAPDVAAKLGLTKVTDQGVKDAGTHTGTVSGDNSGSPAF